MTRLRRRTTAQMNRLNDETCYMCEAPATSREHAPACCLFPESKTFGRDVRRNLITVPSCSAHNSALSKDDEFFRTIAAFAAGPASATAANLMDEKIMPAARRKPVAYGRFIESHERLDDKNTAVKFDVLRFERCIERLVRALHFHTFSAKWLRRIAIASPQFVMKPAAGTAYGVPEMFAKVIEDTRMRLQDHPSLGENEEVFLYKIRSDENSLFFGARFLTHLEVFGASNDSIDLWLMERDSSAQ
jgi:hypothetical protein